MSTGTSVTDPCLPSPKCVIAVRCGVIRERFEGRKQMVASERGERRDSRSNEVGLPKTEGPERRELRRESVGLLLAQQHMGISGQCGVNPWRLNPPSAPAISGSNPPLPVQKFPRSGLGSPQRIHRPKRSANLLCCQTLHAALSRSARRPGLVADRLAFMVKVAADESRWWGFGVARWRWITPAPLQTRQTHASTSKSR